MRYTFILALGTGLLVAGCQVFKPARNLDSLDNASSQTWTVTVQLAGGKHQTHNQAPETFFDYSGTGQAPAPRLTGIVAVSHGSPAVTNQLSARDLSRLRQSSPGSLMLVLYDEGIACLSPDIKKVLEQEMFKNPYDRAEYFRLLRVESDAALIWTRNALGRGDGS